MTEMLPTRVVTAWYWYIAAGLPLLLRVPNSTVDHTWMAQHLVDALLLVAGVLVLCQWAGSPSEESHPGSNVWWIIGPPCMLMSTGLLAMAGVDWLVFRRYVGIELTIVGLVLTGLSGVRPQERLQALRTFWVPATGVSFVVTGFAVLTVNGPLPPPFATHPLYLQAGLMYLLLGVATLVVPATGRFSETPLVRAFLGLVLLAGGAARLFLHLTWPRGLRRVATISSLAALLLILWREHSPDRHQSKVSSAE